MVVNPSSFTTEIIGIDDDLDSLSLNYFVPNTLTIINMIPYTINNYANLIESGDFINFITNFTKMRYLFI